jgi:transformation/transcription domain-associated protein
LKKISATAKFAPSLISLVLAGEKEIMIEPSSPYRAPLVKFLVRYPEETIEIFLNETNIKNAQYNRFLIFLLKHKSGSVFQNILETKQDRLRELILKDKSNHSSVLPEYTPEDDLEAQHEGVLIVHTLSELNSKWLPFQINIVNALKFIWSRELGSSGTNENITFDLWHLVAKILLRFFESSPNNINLLYELLKAFSIRFVPDFQVIFFIFIYSRKN